MSSLTPETVVAADDGVLTTTVGEELVVLDPRGGTYHGLQGVGPHLWDLIQEPTAVASVVEAVAAEYDVPVARCERETTAFVGELVDAGLVEVVDGADP